MSLWIVTATTNPERAQPCVESWRAQAIGDVHVCGVINGPAGPLTAHGLFDVSVYEDEYLGSVAAFQRGVNLLLEFSEPPAIIACLHDDFAIHESRWDEKVEKHFDRHPACGLLGFGGAKGLGSDRLYQDPYDPMQLARIGFRSNLVDAEAHGMRSLLPERVACLDGFSQIGRRAFWSGMCTNTKAAQYGIGQQLQPWDVLAEIGIVHHFYDGALGAIAARYGWETWYLPMRGQHYGGQTAVGDAGYAEWAQTKAEGGDRGLWEAAHRAGYKNFRDVLPIRT